MTAPKIERREFMAYMSAVGLGTTLLPGVLWAKMAAGAEITAATIAGAEEIAGIRLEADEREMMLEGLRNQANRIAALHRVPLDNSVPPAFRFDPAAGGAVPPAPAGRPRRRRAPARVQLPSSESELAFLPVTALSELLRTRQVSSSELTRLYLARIETHDPVLKAVVTTTRERALRQAADADREIAGGRWRGPLHGIPWGAKDLLAVKGYRTTWGAGPFRDQTIDEDATVVQRLDAAGAVLLAKLTLGELAQGDVWFGGRTNNPWKTDQGSSGSSAGPAAATAAALAAFTVGSETLGSISAPSTRCGVTGLRPTFGRIPRTGAMALSWTMDKLGPICRSAEDCALVFGAIHGGDGRDSSAVSAPFDWDPWLDVRGLRIGYVKAAFDLPERDAGDSQRVLHATKEFDDAALAVLRSIGITLIPAQIPEAPYDAMRMILTAEAAAAFDELTRSDRDKLLVQQTRNDWANTFRVARFIPAVDYINANRARTLAMHAWNELFRDFDVIVTPTAATGLSQLVATNLTGHPAVILPHGFRPDGTPVSITFLGGLYGEAPLLAVAAAYQRATDFHRRRPPLMP